MKLLLRFLPFLVLGLMIYTLIKRRSPGKLKTSGFNKKKHIAHGIFIEKTHAGEFNLNDKDGFGLVYGKALQMGFDKKPNNDLYVEYQHAKSGDVVYAMIDTETLEVKTIKQEDVPIRLAEIQSFY